MKRIGLYVVVLMYLLTMCSNDIVTVERARVDWGNDDYVGNNQVWDFSSVPVLDSNVRLVTDLSGNVMERNNYYPYGSLFSENDIAQPYKYSSKEFENRNGLNIYDFHARYFDYAIPCFTTQDPLQEKYHQISPYTYCFGDPINKIDPSGMDTINISYNNLKWGINNIITAKGNDVFRIRFDSRIQEYEFSEAEYGERVNLLNLEVNEDYTLGIYHISGADEGGTGFYVTPGGDASNVVGSNRRIEDGVYPILSPHNGAAWKKPGVGGTVADRGIRFHQGGTNARRSSSGCFVLSYDYTIENNKIRYNRDLSLKASQAFDRKLGAINHFDYKYKNGIRNGSEFKSPIIYKLVLKTR